MCSVICIGVPVSQLSLLHDKELEEVLITVMVNSTMKEFKITLKCI